MSSSYHHGDLAHALLSHAADLAAEASPDAITMRGLARRAGVTHSAPVHHFGTRQRLLTTLAIEGFTALADVLADHDDDIHTMGNAYVAWALDHPGHYAVMWQPRLLDETSAEFGAARGRAWTLLSGAVATTPAVASPLEHQADAHAAFALVHGLASIWLSGALVPPADPATLTAMITSRLAVTNQRPDQQATAR